VTAISQHEEIKLAEALGTGKTSACMYPYVEQLVGYRANDRARKIGGLILEVKGDFCRRVRDLLARHGRAADYVEVSLASPYRYNPLHNELDAYALAYGFATLMNRGRRRSGSTSSAGALTNPEKLHRWR
jgi:hypothetical protein